jgi:hypothetical protein
LISFMEHTVNQHNINCSAMTFDDLDFQHSTLKHNKIIRVRSSTATRKLMHSTLTR